MVKKLTGLLFCAGLILILGFALAGCSNESETTPELIRGQATATARGLNPLSVTVVIDMDTGLITDVRFVHEESIGYGAAVISGNATHPSAKDLIIQYQDFDHLVDVVASATLTREGIKAAGEKALAKIKAGDFDKK
ncbi:MAG: FMN-binding protein [Treponema sp.]|nr:FMN-binding protein [Treponema sp.]